MPASPSALCPASDGGGAGETMLCQASLNQMLENVFTIKKHLLDSVDFPMGRKHPMNRMSWHEVIRGARWPLNLIRLVDIGTEEGYRSRPCEDSEAHWCGKGSPVKTDPKLKKQRKPGGFDTHGPFNTFQLQEKNFHEQPSSRFIRAVLGG